MIWTSKCVRDRWPKTAKELKPSRLQLAAVPLHRCRHLTLFKFDVFPCLSYMEVWLWLFKIRLPSYQGNRFGTWGAFQSSQTFATISGAILRSFWQLGVSDSVDAVTPSKVLPLLKEPGFVGCTEELPRVHRQWKAWILRIPINTPQKTKTKLQKWMFGRWFSFFTGWFVGAILKEKNCCKVS